MNKGFTFCIQGRDYFVPTKLVKRTKTAARKILCKLAYPTVTENIDWLFSHMQLCDMEITSYGYRLCGDHYGNKFTLYVPSGEREDFIIMEEV
jgi:hypothetical protein